MEMLMYGTSDADVDVTARKSVNRKENMSKRKVQTLIGTCKEMMLRKRIPIQSYIMTEII